MTPEQARPGTRVSQRIGAGHGLGPRPFPPLYVPVDEVRGRRFLRVSLPASNPKQQQRYAIWAMCQVALSWYGASQQSDQRLGTKSPRMWASVRELEDGRVV